MFTTCVEAHPRLVQLNTLIKGLVEIFARMDRDNPCLELCFEQQPPQHCDAKCDLCGICAAPHCWPLHQEYFSPELRQPFHAL